MAAFGLKAMAAFAHGKKILARESFWTVLCAFFLMPTSYPFFYSIKPDVKCSSLSCSCYAR